MLCCVVVNRECKGISHNAFLVFGIVGKICTGKSWNLVQNFSVGMPLSEICWLKSTRIPTNTLNLFDFRVVDPRRLLQHNSIYNNITFK